MRNRIPVRICLVLLCLVLLCPGRVLASSAVDTEKKCSLTLHYTQQEQGLAGLEIAIYRVGEVFSDGSYALVSPYQAYPVNIQGLASVKEWQDAATTLSAFLTADQRKADASALTNEKGTVSFENLKTGLYLVKGVSCETESGTSLFGDSLLFLPQTQDNTYCYDLEAKPKHSQFTAHPQENYSVAKLWQDSNETQDRPASVTVQILRNGLPHETVTLTAQNNWCYTWSAPAGAVWAVVEKEVPQGYTVTISANATAFTITNTSTTYEQDDPPFTGDTTPVMLFIVLNGLSGCGLLILGAAFLRGKKHEAKG